MRANTHSMMGIVSSCLRLFSKGRGAVYQSDGWYSLIELVPQGSLFGADGFPIAF